MQIFWLRLLLKTVGCCLLPHNADLLIETHVQDSWLLPCFQIGENSTILQKKGYCPFCTNWLQRCTDQEQFKQVALWASIAYAAAVQASKCPPTIIKCWLALFRTVEGEFCIHVDSSRFLLLSRHQMKFFILSLFNKMESFLQSLISLCVFPASALLCCQWQPNDDRNCLLKNYLIKIFVSPHLVI